MRQMTFLGSKRTPSNGFSLIEVVVALAVILLLSAIALPAFMNAYRMYQLADSATQFAGLLKFTRYEAIRLNKTGDFVVQQVASVPPVTNIWADSDVDTVEDANEKQLVFSGAVNLVPDATVPNTAGLAAAAGTPGFPVVLTTVPLANGKVTFDQRGAVKTALSYVFYLSNLGDPSVGVRAVIVLPSGSVQIWKADSLGNWISIG
jgi:prepilin-type N-terminal cleavage/methylation domain-containing protein